MATLSPGRDFRRMNFGLKTDRSAAVLPATAYGALFTITGGRILVMGIVGEVTTVCSATATNLKLTATPTTGTAVDVATNVAIANKEVGTLFGVSAYGSALVASNAGSTAISVPFVVPIGTLGLTTSATNTGAAKWSLLWVPLDDAASVAAA
jgi:hypothetical protein